MAYDERYMPLLCQANQLAVTNIVRRGMPVFNATTITTIVDRWRLDTHSFHLPCDKMTVTLEDVAMILGLCDILAQDFNRIDRILISARYTFFFVSLTEKNFEVKHA
jgi:hypothetical protein